MSQYLQYNRNKSSTEFSSQENSSNSNSFQSQSSSSRSSYNNNTTSNNSSSSQSSVNSSIETQRIFNEILTSKKILNILMIFIYIHLNILFIHYLR
jgi:hypothetical protein